MADLSVLMPIFSFVAIAFIIIGLASLFRAFYINFPEKPSSQ